jgi:type IV secretion system protein VirD4
LQETARPLLTPDECRTLPGPVKDGDDRIVNAGEMLVFVNGRPAIRAFQPLYFQDPVFATRAAVPPPECSDMLQLGHAGAAPAPGGVPDASGEVDGLEVEVEP